MTPRNAIVEAHARGEISREIALARLLLTGEAPAPGTLPPALETLAEAHRDRLEPLAALARQGFDANDPSSAAALFDRLATEAPEAAVAIYSLGDPTLLAAATAELVAVIDAWVPVTGRSILDLGCGIGRVAAALAPAATSVIGVDVSRGMIAEAKRRTAGIPRLRFVATEGRRLFPADATMDLIIVADSLPFLVQAGDVVLDEALAEFTRLLRPGGDLLVFNWSYRGDPERDVADARSVAARFGYDLLRAGERPFAIWDGTAFHLRRAA